MKNNAFRFYHSDNKELKDQMNAFLSHPALEKLYNLLGLAEGDPYTRYCDFNKKYNLREIKDTNGNIHILPEQEIQDNLYIKEAEKKRNEIYACLQKLGFFSHFESILDNPTHLVILGGPHKSNIERVSYAKEIDHASINHIYALGCDRVLLDKEKESNTGIHTEFDSLSYALQESFSLSSYIDNNQVRQFHAEKEILVLSAPSSRKDYRADTLDTLHFLESISSFTKEDQLLFITHPALVNGHGLTIYKWASQPPCKIDVIGCTIPIEKEDTYSIGRYCQHLLRILRQIFKENL